MKTTLLQRDICWANPEANRQRLEQRLSELPPADLYIFPEMFSTGFCTDPEGIAEENVSEGSLAWMQRIASARGCALAGSVSIKENGKFYNRFYFVYPDGTYCSYDKHHLFTYGGERLRQGRNGSSSPIRGYVSCCRFVMTCVSRYGLVTARIMIWSYTWPAGLHPV